MGRFSKTGIWVWAFYLIYMPAKAEISLNGFASAGGGFFETRNGEYAENEIKEDTFSSDLFNRIALQAGASINEQISVTGQLLAKGSNDYSVEAEWAYLTYTPGWDFNLRFGRLRSPLFIYSDYLDVGYAYPWISPPGLVYRFSFDTVEGMDALYHSSVSGWDIAYQFYYGRLTDEQELFGELLPINIENFSGLNLTFNKDWFTLRASYNVATFDITTPQDNTDLNTLFAALGSQIGPFSSHPDVIDALEMEGEKAAFYGLGAQLNYEGWILNSEWTALRVKDQSFISDDVAWYGMLGKQIEQFLLHITYSRHRDKPDYSFTSNMLEVDPRKEGAERAVLNAESSQLKLGMRYDFADSTAFKLEVTNTDDKKSERRARLVAFSIDTVF